MDKEEFIQVLKEALPYVKGAYECAFPDETENELIAEKIEKAIKALENENFYGFQIKDDRW